MPDMLTPNANSVRQRRIAAGLSQAELATRSGISRPAVSAIEIGRLSPSVTAALALAKALDCTVEQLFGVAESNEPAWAWERQSAAGRYWAARVGGQKFLYPLDVSATCGMGHDGAFRGESVGPGNDSAVDSTLVMATCDPAANLLAEQLRRQGDTRLLTFVRSSREALALLADGKIHLAGIHLAAADKADRNVQAVRDLIGPGYRLIRIACWEEGLVTTRGLGVKSAGSAVRGNLRWVGREQGSGARQCLDELLGDRRTPRRTASDHRGVVEAVRNGWADAGITLRISGEEAGLDFIPIRREAYDVCYPAALERDPRLQGLLRAIRSTEFRRRLAECPGYDTATTGELNAIDA